MNCDDEVGKAAEGDTYFDSYTIIMYGKKSFKLTPLDLVFVARIMEIQV